LNEKFRDSEGSKGFDDNRVAEPIKGFFYVYAYQLKGSLCLLSILYKVRSKERGLLYALASHESMLVFSNDGRERSRQSLSNNSGGNLVEDFQHAEGAEVTWGHWVGLLGNVDNFSVFDPLKNMMPRYV
jgi:hypothetical protein